MRCLILYAAIISAVAGYITPSNGVTLLRDSTSLPAEITTIKTEITPLASEESTSTSSIPTVTTTAQNNLIEEVASEVPVPAIPVELDLPKRRIITYDQRQEGQYNIRADLDNFMIVLIPPPQAMGLALMDFFSKSGSQRNSHTSQNKRKHYSSSSSPALKPEGSKFRQSLRASDINNQHLNYLGLRATNDQLNSAARTQGEFIEGRTPYHVDISSLSEDEIQARLNPDRQVDVLPPSYPLAYQHLMKPYHLEADSSLLPPSELGLQNSDTSQSNNAGYYRFARYIRGDNFLDSNRVTTSNRLGPHHNFSFRRQQLPLYRSDLSLGAAQLYPPLDVPHFKDQQFARNFATKISASNSDDLDGKQSLDSDMEIIVPPTHLPLEDDLDLELQSDSLLQGEAKALLRDGIERCAPGKRRDSYGVCREIEGY